jgi:hypothetical protein
VRRCGQRQHRAFTTQDLQLYGATMSSGNQASEHFIHVERLRQLRQQLVKTTDPLKQKEISQQIEEIDEEIEGRQKNI